MASGGAYTAVRVLTRTDMGRSAPVRLNEIQGDLVLEIYNYLGQDKPFWEMGWPGAFYQGKPQCGFYLEMAERSSYADGRAFGQVVAAGRLDDLAAAPFVYAGDRPRPWNVSYARGGQELGLEVDLMEWKLLRRWTQAGELGFPMLEAPGQASGAAAARQSDSGEICLGQATLRWESRAGRQPRAGLVVCQPGHRALGGGLLRPQPGSGDAGSAGRKGGGGCDGHRHHPLGPG